MKVLQVIDTLNVGGAERVFVDMVNILFNAGVDVEVLLLCEGGILEPRLQKQVRVHKLKRVNKYSVTKAFAAHKLCKAFDIVHVHMRHCYTYIRAVQLSFGGQYKIVLHDHYGDIGIEKKVPLSLKLPSPPGFYIGVSQELHTWSKNHLKPKKSFLLRNIIIAQTGSGYKYKGSDRAIMVANIRPTKNIEFAIDLCKSLGVGLDIYGHKTDSEYYSYLMQKISNNTNIRIIEGITDFSKIYDKYSFGLHTAYSETGPLVLLEYMAYGLPFVCYRTGEVANIVSQDVPDLFVDAFDIEKWQTSISVITQQKDLPQKLQSLFHANFSTEGYLKQCLQIYHDVSC